MPDTIRISGSCAHPWRRGFLTAIVGAAVPFPASAEKQPVLALHELVVSAQDSIDRHEIAVLVVVLGLMLFAVVTAIMLVRARTRWTRLETSSRDEIATLRSDLDRANALLFSEPQVMVDWPAGSDEPRIDGDPGIVGVAAPHRVLAFGSWLEPGKAFAMEQAVENLRSRGEGFSLTLTTLHGHPIEVQGRAIGGRAVLRLKDASGVKRDLVELLSRHESLLSEVASLRALIENLPSPVWTRNAAGQLTFANSAYARAVEAKTGADAVTRRLELLDSTARDNILRALAANGSYAGRLPAVVAGSRRTFDVLDFRTETGSAGIGLDATEAETMRLALARMVDAHRRTLDQLSTGVAMFDADHRLTFYNAAYRALWDLDPAYLDQGPTDSAVIEVLRSAEKLPEEQDFRLWKAQLFEAYRAVEAKEYMWHLPDGRTVRVVTTPNPDGGVTYLFHDVTERLDLDRRFEEMIRVQGETLDNLAEGVAVFASDGRLRLHNTAFARMWRLEPQALAERPHIETITALSRPLHGDGTTWQKLREFVTAIDSREPIEAARLERRDGTVVDCTTVPLPNGATLVTFHDVTDSVNVERALRERNEALEDADKIKVDFVHHVSYELRSPLTTIIGFVHLLGEPSIGPLKSKAARLPRIHHRLHQHAVGVDRQCPRPGHHRCRPNADQSWLRRYPGRHASRHRRRAGSSGRRQAHAQYRSFQRHRLLHRRRKPSPANPVQPAGQCRELLAARRKDYAAGRAARRCGDLRGDRPRAGHSARGAGKGVRLVRNPIRSAHSIAGRGSDSPWQNPSSSCTAARSASPRLSGRARL